MTTKIENQKAYSKIVGSAITKASAKKRADVFIYVGPPVKGLQKFASFVGGYPEHFKTDLEKCPAFKKMFIKPEDLSKFQMKLADGNSVESMFYKKTQEYFSEVKQ
jgi:hypothetical protein